MDGFSRVRSVEARHDQSEPNCTRDGLWNVAFGRIRVALLAFIEPERFGLVGRVRMLPLAVWRLLRRAAGAVLRRLQGMAAFRAALRPLHRNCVIKEADTLDMVEVSALLVIDAGNHQQPIPPLSDAMTNYVAKLRGRVIGFVCLARHGAPSFPQEGYWIHSLTVMQPFRGMGIGEALARRAIEAAKAKDAAEISLIVFDDNLPACNLYRKLGFSRIMLPILEDELITDRFGQRRRMVTLRIEFQ